MDLPHVKKSFSDVSVVGFYHRANLTETMPDGRTIVYSDRTKYSAYAERCRDTTIIKNRAKNVKMLTRGERTGFCNVKSGIATPLYFSYPTR